MEAKQFMDEVEVQEEAQSPHVAGPCWLWLGRVDPKGYGKVRTKKRQDALAHRVSFALFVRNPGAKCVMHRCDNPLCVNPAHLRLGTHAENTADMMRKGRAAYGPRQPHSKLTADGVRWARWAASGGMLQREIAETLGVGKTTIGKVLHGQRWTWVHGPSLPYPPEPDVKGTQETMW